VYVDPSGHFVQVLAGAAAGGLIGAGLNIVRQTIAIAEGAQDEFKWGQLGTSVVAGAIIGGTATVNPVLAAQLGTLASGMGMASGAREIKQGHKWTGGFDLATSALGAYGSKKLADFGSSGKGVTLAEGRSAGEPVSTPTVPPAGPKPNGPIIDMVRDPSGVWVANDAASSGALAAKPTAPSIAAQAPAPQLAQGAPAAAQLPVVRAPLALPAGPSAEPGGVPAAQPGEFSIINWQNYPANVPRPQGPFRLVEGPEYAAARQAANRANRALHQADTSLAGKQIHEVQPVKFGGSPTDKGNKVALDPAEHHPVTTWWNALRRALSGE
jgi:hypothetical protein